MQNYDAIIVGAGPAGSSAAYFLGNSGISTLLLDKEEFPKSKLCAGGISPRALKTLDEMDFTSQIENKFHKITGTRIIAPNDIVIEGTIPQTERYKPYGYVIPRITLDKKLIDHAIQTGNVKPRQEEVTSLIINVDYVKGVKTKNGEEIYSKVVVLADGANSHLADKCNVITPSRKRKVVTLESWRDRIETDDKINIYYHEKLLPFYFWIFPEDDNRANVGLCLDPLKYKGNSIQHLFTEILVSRTISSMIGKSVETHKPKSWPISLRDPQKIDVGNGLVPIGDSGGFANPFTAEGIYYALESGKFAAIAIKEAFERRDVSAKGLNLFERLCYEEFRDDINVSYKLKNLFENPEFINNLLLKASTNLDLNSLLQGIIANVIPKREILKVIE